MYPRIPSEEEADTLGSAEHILGTAEVPEFCQHSEGKNRLIVAENRVLREGLRGRE
jgi:hypothetical protein